MDIQLEKQEIIEQLLQTNDESLIASIKSLLTKDKKDFWEELSPEEKEGIEEGIEDFKNGNTTSWDDFIINYL
ncbi:hypothetical protein HNP99_002389 [Flavobacterium sp. 28A]|uniref:hypothetical protein n=1 Tax=Flavobacterium sp. 28A TaxID=2735895 RepID=UPI00156E248F|nr:hypothetical protein [Flavobacterium sp. 28A]NRT16027.1 hypothetical protein [Flavobacterium sp. 28A]